MDPQAIRDLLSQRALQIEASEIRALFSVVERPEIISLAGGNTYTEPVVQRVAACVKEVLEQTPARALGYGPGAGLEVLRQELTTLMATEGIRADPRDIIVTDGAQQGLDLMAKVFIDPGDVVVCEAPTYVGALSAFSAYEARIEGVEIDADGIVVEELDRRLSELRSTSARVKFLYLVPTFQNPSGVTLSAERRLEVLAIARKHQVLVLEDNPYAQVRFEGPPQKTLRELEADHVVYLGTLSKTFAPGIRIGWILAPEALRDRLVLAKEAANLCTAPFNQLVAARYLASPDLENDLELVRKVYRERCMTMLDAIDEYFPAGHSLVPPSGGLFVWVRLNAAIDSRAMLARALEAGVAYLPGTACYPRTVGPAPGARANNPGARAKGARADKPGAPNGERHMRLNFSYAAPEAIEEGIRRLGAVIDKEIELAESLGLT